jgi:hypothetical protein
LDGIFVPRPRARDGFVEGPLGPTPFFAAFFVIVNIHHYFMDHAIWRREHPETRFLRVPAPSEATVTFTKTSAPSWG